MKPKGREAKWTAILGPYCDTELPVSGWGLQSGGGGRIGGGQVKRRSLPVKPRSLGFVFIHRFVFGFATGSDVETGLLDAKNQQFQPTHFSECFRTWAYSM